jgi:hypothetical protein
MVAEWGKGNCTLEDFEAEELDDLSGEAIGEQLPELFAMRNRLDAQIQRRVARFDKLQGYSAGGALSAQSWLRWKCHLSPSEASERVKVAREMLDLDITAGALAEGSISYRHAALIARTASELGDKWEANAEDILVTAGKELDPGRLRYAVGHLKHYLMPDGVLADANEQHRLRGLHLSQTLDGVFRLDGQLDAEGGAALKAALDALMTPPHHDDRRSASQRRADALVELAQRQLEAGTLPESGGQKPHLVVSTTLETLAQAAGAPAAELEGADLIPAETARRIACDCSLTLVVDGEPRGTSRTIPGATRRALIARDKTCRHEGCDMPGAWCDGHHIDHWANGGSHKLPNLTLLCRRHHRMEHEGRAG